MDECVASVVRQTYRNLEIILVDDGSPDRCPQMCDEWEQRDPRVRVLHKENGGLSDARNAGLEICTGDWIVFVDSDDWIHFQAIEKMLQVACEQKVALVMSAYRRVEENELITDTNLNGASSELIDREEGLTLLYNNQCTQTVACAKLYHHLLWKKNRFPLGKINEDEYVTYKLIYDAERMVYIKDQLYYYRQRGNSIMASVMQVPSMDLLEALWERQLFFEEKRFDNLMRKNINVFVTACIDRAIGLRNSEKEYDREMRVLKDYLVWAQSYNSYLSRKNYLKRIIYLSNPRIYIRLISRLRKKTFISALRKVSQRL